MAATVASGISERKTEILATSAKGALVSRRPVDNFSFGSPCTPWNNDKDIDVPHRKSEQTVDTRCAGAYAKLKKNVNKRLEIINVVYAHLAVISSKPRKDLSCGAIYIAEVR